MSEPYPIRRWYVQGVWFQTVQGRYGRVPRNDRLLKLNGHPLSFEDYLSALAAGAWTSEVEAAVRDFFYRNEDAIYPPPASGRGMLQHAEAVLRAEGLEAARRYVQSTKISSERCGACGKRSTLGLTPGSEKRVCLDCHMKATEQKRRVLSPPRTFEPDTHDGLLPHKEAQLAAQYKRAYPWLVSEGG